MDFEAVSKIVFDQFSKQQVRFAIIGGFAMHAAGFARATADIDFLVHHEDVGKVKSILTAFGYDIGHESKDVINFWGQLKPLGGIDFIIAHRKYALSMLERAKPYELLQYMVRVVMPEDIIGLKLQAIANDPSRYMQDMGDIEWLLKNHRESLNMDILREYFGLFDKLSELDRFLEVD